MQHTSSRLAATAAGLVALVLTATPGQAAALQLGSYYQESSNLTSNTPPTSGACNGLIYCYLEFAKVPTGKQLAVTQVSCSLSVSQSTAKPVSMYLGTRRGINAVERFQILVPSTMPSNQPGYTLVVSAPTLQLYEAGDRPEIFVGFNNAASTTGFCTIAGQVQNAP
jgi:hypothetical protein